MKCFYHSADLDGHCSGALVKMGHPECEMIGIDYGQEFPWDSIDKGDVWMVDFSLQPFELMQKLNSVTLLTWIDHHKSAVEEMEKHGWDYGGISRISPVGIQKIGVGACQLVWQYLARFETRKIPTFVKLLAEYDIWDHSDPRTLSFQYGMRQQKDTSPGNQKFWNSLFDVEEVQRITEKGGIVLEYIINSNKSKASQLSFETEIAGLKCIAMNSLTNSKGFDSVWDAEKYDAMLSFVWRKGKWTVSLYSDKADIDVSEICKARGGGGHKGAAGFQCKELPFKLY